jgi:hypothetical protein
VFRVSSKHSASGGNARLPRVAFFFGGAMRGWHGVGWHFASLGDGYAFRRRAGEGAGVEK